MAVGIQKKINLALIVLGCSLPLFSASPGWTQTCTEAEIRANIAKFKDIIDSPDENPSYQNVIRCREDAIPPLIATVQNKQENPEVRSYAAWALGEIGEGTAEDIKALMSIVKDKQDNPEVRSSAAYALSSIGEGTAEDVKALVGVVKDKQDNSGVRSNATLALSSIVRRNAAWALSSIGEGTAEDVKALVGVVKDKQDNSGVRRNAAFTLREIGQGTPEDVKALVGVVKDKQDNSGVRSNAAWALGGIGKGTAEDIKALMSIVKDKQDNPEVRSSAAYALSSIGEGTAEDVKALVSIVKDKQDDAEVRGSAASALGGIGKGTAEVVKALVGVVKDKQDNLEVRNDAAFALEVINSNLVKDKDQLSIQQLDEWIRLFQPVLEMQDILERARDELRTDINTLKRTLEDKKEYQISQKLLQNSSFAILVHALFWTGLIFLYPKSPQIQAIFFWNPKVRKIIGLWYVDLALTWVPFLRSKLFEPFRESLRSDADLESFNPQAYFPTSPVKHQGSRKIKPLNQAIPEIQGQIVLEGESGLGKSMFLRHLVKSSERIVVYLPAKKCDFGVMAGIQAKLHGYVKEDPNFLQSLIYSGAIDICIDGLNEVTPDTRANITSFVESNFKGNIIMTTQPIDWTPPSTSTPKIYTLQPLKDEHIEQFLLSRTEFITEAQVTGEAYKQACQAYLAQMLNNQQDSEEEQLAVRRMLSNPMELTLVAQMLSQGEKPNVLNLQQQQYQMMAEEYQQMHLCEFPLAKFSERVYQMRLKDEVVIPPEDWLNELKCMEQSKMVLSRQFVDLAGEKQQEWRFRHDKIQDFFMVQTFLGTPKDNRIVDNISDPRFRGVYFLLAAKMPIDAAQKLREELIQYAADTKDHTVSDTFIQLLRSRQVS